MTRNFDDEKREPQPIIIEDLRHSRAGEEEEAEEPEVEAAAEPPAAAPPAPAAAPMEILEPLSSEPLPIGAGREFELPQADAEHNLDHPHELDHEHVHDHDHGDGQDEAVDEAEYRHLLQIFELGIDNYQKNQIGIYIQFALIHMGRAPHPVTNLVATDLPMARFAIDLLHICFTHLEPGLQPQERQEFQSVLASLQMTYTQLAGNLPVPPVLPEA